jgi:rubrerythrin
MKLLISSRHLGDIERIRGVLEDADIACTVKNQNLQNLPVLENIPELWVMEDEKLAAAQELLRKLKPQSEGDEPWTCGNCGETLESQFNSCWQCGTAKA